MGVMVCFMGYFGPAALLLWGCAVVFCSGCCFLLPVVCWVLFGLLIFSLWVQLIYFSSVLGLLRGPAC